jgi:hypothetical protein
MINSKNFRLLKRFPKRQSLNQQNSTYRQDTNESPESQLPLRRQADTAYQTREKRNKEKLPVAISCSETSTG